MKKVLKIIGIVLASLIVLIAVSGIIAFNFVLTPKRITPLVNKKVAEYSPFPAKTESVDITFFKTFPDVSLHLENTLVNSKVTSDTMACINDLFLSVNLKKYLKDKDIVINKVTIDEGAVYINLDEFAEESETEKSSSFTLPKNIDLQSLDIDGLKVKLVSPSREFDACLDDLQLKVKGNLTDADVKADIDLIADNTNIVFDSVVYAASVDVAIKTPVNMTLTNDGIEKISFDKTTMAINSLMLGLAGIVDMSDTSNIALNVDYQLDECKIDSILALVPEKYLSFMDNMKLACNVALKGNLNGVFGEKKKPVLTADMTVKDADFSYKTLATKLENTDFKVSTVINMNDISDMELDLKDFSTNTDMGPLKASGKISDLLGDILCDLTVDANLDLKRCLVFVKDDVGLQADGRAKVDLKKLKLNVSEIRKSNFRNAVADGTIVIDGLDVNLKDNIFANSDNVSVKVVFPGTDNKYFKDFVDLGINSDNLTVKLISDKIDANLRDADIQLSLSDVVHPVNDSYYVNCTFKMSNFDGTLDTISLVTVNPNGSYVLFPSERNNQNAANKLSLKTNSMKLDLGNTYKLTAQTVGLHGQYDRDSTQTNILSRWNPDVDINLKEAFVTLANDSVIRIKTLQSKLNPDRFKIGNSSFFVNNSSFNLYGDLYNMNGYLDNKELLKGEFNFTSPYADINQLIDFINGFVVKDTVDIADENIDKEANPLIVPHGVDFVLNTNVRKAKYNTTGIEDLGGKLYINDGDLILEQMAFTCNAARMQLTALYRSPRKNHLFAALDFHLLDISIAELIDMIPDIDTVFPMLKSFSGNGEFHIAAETYLTENYSPKLSTLKGAAAFSGQNLVILDSETFNTIAQYLQFNNREYNKIDSLAVEATIFRNEIDVYPFMVTMDKYSAIIGGRHTLANTFDYNISMMNPVLLRVGVDVKGTLGNLQIIPTGRKYKDLYRPERQNVVMQRTLTLKQLISDSLKKNVKP